MNAAGTPTRWRSRLLRALGYGVLFVAVLLGVQAWQTRDVPEGPLPELRGVGADGRPLILSDWLARQGGRPALVYVWGSWCPVCRAMEGTVAGVAADWPVFGVALQSGPAPEVAKHLVQRGLAIPSLVDEDGRLSARLGVRGVPAFFVVQGDGRLRHATAGFTSGWGLRARLAWAQRFPRGAP